MRAMVRRSPEMVVAGIAGVIILRAALWLTISADVAHFIVFRLLPVWVVVELLLAVGTVLCVFGLATGRVIALFGQRLQPQLSIPLCLVGGVTLAMEAVLWSYGLAGAA